MEVFDAIEKRCSYRKNFASTPIPRKDPQKTHLLISAGVGVARPAIRLYCSPDILVIDVKPEANHNRSNTA